VTHHERLQRIERLWELFGALTPDVEHHVRISAQGARGDGGALVYLLDTPEGVLMYQDTSGHWTGIVDGLRPDVAIVAAAGRGNIDGEPIQGSLADFVGRQASLLRPRSVILAHHDDWLPGFSVATDTKPIRESLARFAPRSELVELDYLDGHTVFA